MDGLDELEEYMRTARMLELCTFRATGGGGHPRGLIILDGGVGTVAKPADANQDAPMMVRREAAAWVVARALGWSDMVATTVVRRVPSFVTGHEAESSLSVVWPDCTPDVDPGFDDADVWRAAVFDAIIEQSDRAGHNWLAVPSPESGTSRLKLVDHGYSFYFPGRGLSSRFFEAKRGEPIPSDTLDAVQTLLDDWPSELDELFEDEDEVPRKARYRAEHLAHSRVLNV